LKSTSVAPVNPFPKTLTTLPGCPNAGEKLVIDEANAA
jgi:hypothetical protein